MVIMFTMSMVLELCWIEWFRNKEGNYAGVLAVLELCWIEWFRNIFFDYDIIPCVLELCWIEWFRNWVSQC